MYLYENPAAFFACVNLDKYILIWHFKYCRQKWVQELVGPKDFDAVNKSQFPEYEGNDFYCYSENWEVFVKVPQDLLNFEYQHTVDDMVHRFLVKDASNEKMIQFHKDRTDKLWRMEKLRTVQKMMSNGKKQKD